jgi:hypothetical protein
LRERNSGPESAKPIYRLGRSVTEERPPGRPSHGWSSDIAVKSIIVLETVPVTTRERIVDANPVPNRVGFTGMTLRINETRQGLYWRELWRTGESDGSTAERQWIRLVLPISTLTQLFECVTNATLLLVWR